MQDADVLDRHWRDEGLSRPLHRAMTFTQEGLVLGRSTLLAEFETEKRATRDLALDGNEARVLSLLTAAHGKPVAEGVVEKIRRAAEFWCVGEKKRWRKFILPSSACRMLMRWAPTASSSPGQPSKKA